MRLRWGENQNRCTYLQLVLFMGCIRAPIFIFMKKTRKQKFIEECAMGVSAYRAALNAGYKEYTAKGKAHLMKKKYEEEILIMEQKVEKIIEEELKYTIHDVFDELEEVRKLSLLPDEKGNYGNLSAANKAIENKARLIGAFEKDNEQKTPGFPPIIVANERDRQALEDI